jgi:NAD(P)-dependent dehydrogenase (short-subunit alcohol dehydrogenase family)
LALEVAAAGITVNTILPGYIDTPLMKPLADSMGISTSELSDRIAKGIPMKRIGTIHDVGNLAVFLASAESEYITGQEFVIDGGNIIQEKSSL